MDTLSTIECMCPLWKDNQQKILINFFYSLMKMDLVQQEMRYCVLWKSLMLLVRV